ncbi:hypothetical protein SEA_VIEENROSE_34 [Streptomyces phage VieEnRose]|nr:hypothetical protein SEA_VIEENROSE_34 [Streptomyces phage VieEnRose]
MDINTDREENDSVRETTVTIKYGKGYEETWAVFKGSPDEVRQDIVDYFGFDRDSVAGLTLNQLVINATQVAHGGGNAAASLGAVSLPKAAAASTPAAAPAQSAPAASTDDPWAAAGQPASSPAPAAPAAQPEANPIFELIENCKSVDELKKLWATNQAAFADESVMTAWKAKGRSLKSAA